MRLGPATWIASARQGHVDPLIDQLRDLGITHVANAPYGFGGRDAGLEQRQHHDERHMPPETGR